MNLTSSVMKVATSRPCIALAARWFRGGSVAQGPALTPAVGLTFDDGPDPRWTPGVLDVLAATDARATFFLVGKAAQRHPDLVRRVVDAGHSIGTHSWSHRRDTVNDERAFLEDLDRSVSLLVQLTGKPVRWLRYPYGRHGRVPGHSPRALAARGLRAIHWSVSSHDSRLSEPAAIVARLASTLRPGAILLFHDGIADEDQGPIQPPFLSNRDASLAALPRILALLQARALRPVTLDVLLDPP